MLALKETGSIIASDMYPFLQKAQGHQCFASHRQGHGMVVFFVFG